MESSKEPTPDISPGDLRGLLSPEATQSQCIDGLLAIGFSQQDLFEIMEVRYDDLGLVSQDELEKAQRVFGEDQEMLIEWGVSEEELEDGVATYLERQMQTGNDERMALFADKGFLSQRSQRIFQDIGQVAYILMENEENQPIILSWLTTPNPKCEGEPPIDRLRTDPVQVLVAAHGTILTQQEDQAAQS